MVSLADGVYGGLLSGTAVTGTLPTAVELTTAWNVNAAYEHFCSALADVTLRRLHESGVWRHSQ